MHFSLLFTPRTGSHFLSSCLGSHTEVNHIAHEGETTKKIEEGSELWPSTDLVFGNKIRVDILYKYDRFDLIRKPAIVNYRNNKLSQYISLALAVRENRFGAWKDSAWKDSAWKGSLIGGDGARNTTIPNPATAGRYGRNAPSHYSEQPIYIDIKQALGTIKRWVVLEKRLKEEVPDALWLEYGELIAGDGLIRAQEFLGLSIQKLRTLRLKQSSGINIEYVGNIEEIMNSELAGWL